MVGEARNYATKQAKAFFDDGDDFHEFLSLASSFSSIAYSVLPLEKINETVLLLGGDYEIILAYGYAVDGTNRAFVSNLIVDNTASLGNHSETMWVAANRMYITRHFPNLTLQPGDHDFIVDFGVDAAPQIAEMFDVILKFRRLPQNDNL